MYPGAPLPDSRLESDPIVDQRMPVQIVVSGGAGFIGTNLVRALIERKHEVRVVDDLSSGSLAGLPYEAELVQEDIRDRDVVDSVLSGADAVVHLAARGSVPRSVADPQAAFDVNANGTLSVLEAARRNGSSVVFASSSSVYGRNRENPKSEKMWVSPMSPYAASKLAAESLVSAYAESYGMKVLSFRFFNVFGPWQRPDHVYAAVVPKWMWRAMHRLAIQVDGDGTQSRDFTSVHTVTDVLVDALERGVSLPTPVNLAYGNNFSLLELRAAMESIIGEELEVEYGPPRKADVKASQNDPALLKELFPGIEPRSFESTLRETYEWLLSQRGQIPLPE